MRACVRACIVRSRRCALMQWSTRARSVLTLWCVCPVPLKGSVEGTDRCKEGYTEREKGWHRQHVVEAEEDKPARVDSARAGTVQRIHYTRLGRGQIPALSISRARALTLARRSHRRNVTFLLLATAAATRAISLFPFTHSLSITLALSLSRTHTHSQPHGGKP